MAYNSIVDPGTQVSYGLNTFTGQGILRQYLEQYQNLLTSGLAVPAQAGGYYGKDPQSCEVLEGALHIPVQKFAEKRYVDLHDFISKVWLSQDDPKKTKHITYYKKQGIRSQYIKFENNNTRPPRVGRSWVVPNEKNVGYSAFTISEQKETPKRSEQKETPKRYVFFAKFIPIYVYFHHKQQANLDCLKDIKTRYTDFTLKGYHVSEGSVFAIITGTEKPKPKPKSSQTQSTQAAQSDTVALPDTVAQTQSTLPDTVDRTIQKYFSSDDSGNYEKFLKTIGLVVSNQEGIITESIRSQELPFVSKANHAKFKMTVKQDRMVQSVEKHFHPKCTYIDSHYTCNTAGLPVKDWKTRKDFVKHITSLTERQETSKSTSQ